MRRVVGYLRVSSESQATEGVSLDAQRTKLAAYCHALDLELVALEADEGVSAKTLRRPGLQRALAALEEGRADAVLVTKLDRLTRSVRDLGDLVERFFASERWSLLSVGDSIDTKTAAGRQCIVRVDDEAETVARIVALRGEGLSLRRIADTLTMEGRATKRGGRWAAEQVRAALERLERAA